MNANNADKSLKSWIFEHSYAILVALLIIAFNYGIFTFRIDVISERVFENKQSIKDNKDKIDDIETVLIQQNAIILQKLEAIEYNMQRMQLKIDGYDRSIKEFYQKYDLKPKGG